MTLGLRVGCPAVSEWKADGFKVRNFFFSFFYVQGEKLDLERFNSSRERSVYEVGGIRHEGCATAADASWAGRCPIIFAEKQRCRRTRYKYEYMMPVQVDR